MADPCRHWLIFYEIKVYFIHQLDEFVWKTSMDEEQHSFMRELHVLARHLQPSFATCTWDHTHYSANHFPAQTCTILILKLALVIWMNSVSSSISVTKVRLWRTCWLGVWRCCCASLYCMKNSMKLSLIFKRLELDHSWGNSLPLICCAWSLSQLMSSMTWLVEYGA